MLPLPSMDTAINAHKAAAHAAEAQGGPQHKQPTRNRTQRPPGGVGRQTSQAAVVADEMRSIVELMEEFAQFYDREGLDEPAGLLRNEAGNLESYANLVLNGAMDSPLVIGRVFGQTAEDKAAVVDRTPAALIAGEPLDVPSLFDDE